MPGWIGKQGLSKEAASYAECSRGFGVWNGRLLTQGASRGARPGRGAGREGYCFARTANAKRCISSSLDASRLLLPLEAQVLQQDRHCSVLSVWVSSSTCMSDQPDQITMECSPDGGSRQLRRSPDSLQRL